MWFVLSSSLILVFQVLLPIIGFAGLSTTRHEFAAARSRLTSAAAGR